MKKILLGLTLVGLLAASAQAQLVGASVGFGSVGHHSAWSVGVGVGVGLGMGVGVGCGHGGVYVGGGVPVVCAPVRVPPPVYVVGPPPPPPRVVTMVRPMVPVYASPWTPVYYAPRPVYVAPVAAPVVVAPGYVARRW
jgi:hypothetical protein